MSSSGTGGARWPRSPRLHRSCSAPAPSTPMAMCQFRGRCAPATRSMVVVCAGPRCRPRTAASRFNACSIAQSPIALPASWSFPKNRHHHRQNRWSTCRRSHRLPKRRRHPIPMWLLSRQWLPKCRRNHSLPKRRRHALPMRLLSRRPLPQRRRSHRLSKRRRHPLPMQPLSRRGSLTRPHRLHLRRRTRSVPAANW